MEIWLRLARPGPHDFAAELCHERDGHEAWLFALGSYRFFAHSARPAEGAASFAFSGTDPLGAPFALRAGAPFDEEELAGLDARATGLADGAHFEANNSGPWRIAALERPSLLGGQNAGHF
jgi:hypothetical protein